MSIAGSFVSAYLSSRLIKRLHCEKTKKKRQLSPVELASFFVFCIVAFPLDRVSAACVCSL
jgi:hypothetical protein